MLGFNGGLIGQNRNTSNSQSLPGVWSLSEQVNAKRASAWPYVYNGISDFDVISFLTAVETADGQELESDTRLAFNTFVVGCKADNLWSDITCCCILAGARTLAGALTPLKGASPTNTNFVSGDYNRETGLKANGTSKSLTQAVPSPSATNGHYAIYVSTANTLSDRVYIGDQQSSSNVYQVFASASSLQLWYGGTTGNQVIVSGAQAATGFIGVSRSSSTSLAARVSGTDYTNTTSFSGTAPKGSCGVFARNTTAGLIDVRTDSRIAFYSIGTNIDLSKLNARVNTLITDLAAAIP